MGDVNPKRVAQNFHVWEDGMETIAEALTLAGTLEFFDMKQVTDSPRLFC